MKKEEKKELLCKLREVSHLDRKQRFSEKVFRHLRSTNMSHEASIHHDNHLRSQIISPNAYQILLSPMQNHSSGEGSIINNSNTLQALQQPSYKQRNFTQETGRQYYQQVQYLSFRNESIEGKVRFSKIKLHTGPSQTNSTMVDLSHKQDYKVKDKCHECSKKKGLREQTIEKLTSEIKQLKIKLEDYQQRYSNLKKAIQPYKNNVSLMSVILQSLKEKGKSPGTQDCEEQVDFDLEASTNELKETTKVNLWLLKEGKQKDKHFNHQKYTLKCEIDSIAAQNSELKKQIQDREQKIRFFEEQLTSIDSNHPLRERLDMCAQELYMFKLKYQQKVKQNGNLNLKIEEMKYKLNVLTSLIGCAIIFDVHQKEKDKKHLKEILNKIDKYENITNHKMDNNVFQYLKILKSEQTENAANKERKSNKLRMARKESLITRDEAKDKQCKNQLRRLYYPNYLVLLGEQSISARLEHIVIKPSLFIKIRSILDSKYIDYRLFETSASKFSQFCNSHLRSYDIQSAEKKPYYITRIMSENQIKEINLQFIRCLMDERIEDIPEVEIFRDMLLGKYEEDQIYFYLMCRHKFVEGSELQNFINSGDPSKFIKFDKAKRIVIKITQKFGRSIQNFICHHLNQRRIVKSHSQFIRLYYLLKLLLQVYRKIRAKKLAQLKQLFDHVLETTKKDRVNFMQFHELLRKNFEFLTRTDICSMYQQTIALLQSQNQLEGAQVEFFQCFSASSSTKIFLQEMMKFDVKLGNDCEEEEMIINYKNQSLKQSQVQDSRNHTKYRLSHSKKQTSSLASSQINGHETKLLQKRNEPNKVNELWPDSVYILGNERLTKQYFELCKSNPSKLRNKIDTLQFLVGLTMGHLVKQDIHLNHKQDLMAILNDAIYNLVQFLNKLQNTKLQHENEINLASRKIGKFFKNKIYQFYHEMLEDINAITDDPGKKGKKDKQKNLIQTIKMI